MNSYELSKGLANTFMEKIAENNSDLTRKLASQMEQMTSSLMDSINSWFSKMAAIMHVEGMSC
jgi:hypothetical protein